MEWPSRLCLNQYSVSNWPVDEWLEEAARRGAAVGINRDMTSRFGYDRALECVRRLKTRVVIYMSVGYYAAGVDFAGRPRTFDDDLRSLDQAVELGAELVNVSTGGLLPRHTNIESARRRFADGLARLVPYAVERNLKLSIEPLHPIFSPRISVLGTLRQAIDLMDEIGHECIGINLDMYHSWWEPDLVAQLQRAKGRIHLVQVNDWSPELAAVDPINRAPIGKGCIDFGAFMEGLRGYDGWFDVETNDAELKKLSLPGLFDEVSSQFQQAIGSRL